MRRALYAGVCAAALLPAAPAGASVTIGSESITVAGERAAATITRKPFRIAFGDGAGTDVLEQVGSAPGPLVVPPAVEPAPLGFDNVDSPTLYSPFAFMVGRREDTQHPGATWLGNRLVGAEGGTMYAAREVVDARAEGDGVRLELSTSDPGGRRIVATVAPGPAGTIRVSARVTPQTDVIALADSFESAPAEAFRGFGGRHNALDQRGNDFYNWVEQQNTSAGPFGPITDAAPGAGGEGYQFPNGPTAAYYVQSQFVSSRGYGFMLDRPELAGWRLASDRADAWQVAVAAPALDYLVAPGDYRTAIGTLTRIGGRHSVPPEWAVGPQLDRLTRFTGETAQTYEASVRQDLDEIERHDLPLDAYRIEAWHHLSPAALREIIGRLHARGIRALVYFRAFVGTDEAGTDKPEEFETATRERYVATTPDGRPYVFLSNLYGQGALIDFTNPRAVDWWRARIRAALDLGADGFMQDFGEQVLDDMRFANGETGETMHNRYPTLFHRTTREIVDEYMREHPERRIWFYTRAGYTGSPAYEMGNFPGDETTDWSRSTGIASLATDMLNRAIGGAYGYGTDIGGYFDFHTPPTTKELFLRWAEWAALSPVFRLHGSINEGTHTPWSFDAETVRVYKELSALHLRARPLILDLWREASETGVPPTRPLWLEFPDDPEASRQDQEWMLGPDLLVAPVVSEGASGRDVYFPRGCWQHGTTGERFSGPGAHRVEAPVGRLPWFERCESSPLEEAAGRCLSSRMKVGARGIGRIRVGQTRAAIARTAGLPLHRGRRAYRYCVQGGGRVLVAFDRRGRAQLVASTARGHRTRGIGRGASRARTFRAYRGLRRVVGRGVYRSGVRQAKVLGIRRGRVRFVAVAVPELLEDRRALARALRDVRL